MKTIAFYSNSITLGGHELMGVRIMHVLKKFFNIYVILSNQNIRLKEVLMDEDIRFYELNYSSNRFQILRNKFSRRHHNQIKNILTLNKPDIIVLLQGNIDLSLNAVFPASELKIPTISYLPLAQPLFKVSKYKGLGFLKDCIRKRNYSRPNHFLTISQAQKDNIAQNISAKRIEVLPNVIDTKSLKLLNKDASRIKLGLPLYKYIIGYVGRIEEWHKGLDLYSTFLKEKAPEYPNVIFLFVGSGNYENIIKKLERNNSNIKFLDWRENLNEVYSSIDAIIMPSRFEGVSLTMLEALYLDIPIIANNIPEFKEYINPENLFDLNDFETIEQKINMLISNSFMIQNGASYLIYNQTQFTQATLKIFSKFINNANS